MTEKQNVFFFAFRKLWFFPLKLICSLSNIYWIWKQFYLSKCIPLHASNNNSNQKLCLIETHKYCFIAFKVNFDEVIKSDCKIKLFQCYTLIFSRLEFLSFYFYFVVHLMVQLKSAIFNFKCHWFQINFCTLQNICARSVLLFWKWKMTWKVQFLRIFLQNFSQTYFFKK